MTAAGSKKKDGGENHAFKIRLGGWQVTPEREEEASKKPRGSPEYWGSMLASESLGSAVLSV